MSRIGKLPIPLPTGVDLSVSDGMITVKGPKGTLQQAVVGLVSIDREGDDVVVRRVDDSRPARANHGLMRALVANMVTGVTAGFTKRLDVIGVGYRSEVKGRELVMQLGYSHPVVFPIPQGIDVEVDKSGKIVRLGDS